MASAALGSRRFPAQRLSPSRCRRGVCVALALAVVSSAAPLPAAAASRAELREKARAEEAEKARDAEKARADAEKARADAEKARADTEKARNIWARVTWTAIIRVGWALFCHSLLAAGTDLVMVLGLAPPFEACSNASELVRILSGAF